MCGSFWTYLKISQILRKICFLHCIGNTVGKLLECFSKIVYRFENCLGFVIASVVCLFVSSRFSKFNKHFAEEQNNWSHTCEFPDLFYMCMQYSVTQNMFKPSTSHHLWCCGRDQSRTPVSTHGPDHVPPQDFWPHAWGPDPGPSDTCGHYQGPRPEATVTGLHRGQRPRFGSISVGGSAQVVLQKGAAPLQDASRGSDLSALFLSPGHAPAPQWAVRRGLSWTHL